MPAANVIQVEGQSKMSTRTMLIIAGVALLVILIIGIVIYRSGKKSGEAAGAINLSSPINDNPSDNSSQGVQSSLSSLKVLAQQIHDEMSGLNLGGHNIELWQQVLALSDTDFVRFYNEYNADFQKDSGETFGQWVNDQAVVFVPFVGTQWGTVKGTVLSRMNKLNLS